MSIENKILRLNAPAVIHFRFGQTPYEVTKQMAKRGLDISEEATKQVVQTYRAERMKGRVINNYV